MPRQSAAAAEQAEFMLPGKPLPVPSELTPEQSSYWSALVDRLPPGRFDAGDAPLLTELVQAQARSRQINEQLDGMRTKALTMTTVPGGKVRGVFIQLAAQAREESKLISSLCVRLRLGDQSKTRKETAAARDRMMGPTMPPPWSEAPLGDDKGKH